jgi:hypothetical protein
MNDKALISICITLMGALITVVWRAGGLVATLTSALAELRATVAELKAGLEHVRDYPVLRQRVETLEDVVRSSLTSKVESLWAKVFSLDKHFAVKEARESRPDFSPEEVQTQPDRPAKP